MFQDYTAPIGMGGSQPPQDRTPQGRLRTLGKRYSPTMGHLYQGQPANPAAGRTAPMGSPLMPSTRFSGAGMNQAGYAARGNFGPQGGVVPGQGPQMNAVQQARMQGPSPDVMAEAMRSGNSVLAGYMLPAAQGR